EITAALGIRTDYAWAQALLTGDLPPSFDPGEWQFSLSEDDRAPYLLLPRNPSVVRELRFTPFFKLAYARLSDGSRDAEVTYAYPGDRAELPSKIHVRADAYEAVLRLRKADTLQVPDVRFQLPPGCKRLRLK
ncbi:MAG: hypothetical protein GXO27_01760, partial [Chlorobi bacterium]|nr:hypothetical protein [Chlorobiota bacterium]